MSEQERPEKPKPPAIDSALVHVYDTIRELQRLGYRAPHKIIVDHDKGEGMLHVWFYVPKGKGTDETETTEPTP